MQTSTPTPPVPVSDLREILRLSLDGHLSSGFGMLQWFDRMEGRK
ncbi:MAG: hypothetical protein ACK4GW_04670 [Pseudorhodobacter sp.]